MQSPQDFVRAVLKQYHLNRNNLKASKPIPGDNYTRITKEDTPTDLRVHLVSLKYYRQCVINYPQPSKRLYLRGKRLQAVITIYYTSSHGDLAQRGAFN